MSTPDSAPGPQELLVVRYHRGLGTAAVVVAVPSLVLGFARPDVLNIVMGVVLGVLGASYIVGTGLVLTTDELQLKSPIGLTTKRFEVHGPADLRMDGSTLHHVPRNTKVVSLGFGFDREDVKRLKAYVGGGR